MKASRHDDIPLQMHHMPFEMCARCKWPIKDTASNTHDSNMRDIFDAMAQYLGVREFNLMARAMGLKFSDAERVDTFRRHISGKLSLAENVRMAEALKLPANPDWFKALATRDMQSAIDRFNVSFADDRCMDILEGFIRTSMVDVTYAATFTLNIMHMHLSYSNGMRIGPHARLVAEAEPRRLTHYLREIQLIYTGSRFFMLADREFRRMTGDLPRTPEAGQDGCAWIVENI